MSYQVSSWSSLRRLALPVLVLFGACSEPADSPVSPSRPALSTSASATLVECPTDVTLSVSDTVDILGGTLKLTDNFGGTHEVVFPANAVSSPTLFTLTVPASQYVKVRVTAKDLLTGSEGSVTFPADAQPTLAVSYKRCTRSNIVKGDLHLYNVDPGTDAVLEGPFGGKEGNTADPRVVGNVPHFSDYSMGVP